MYDICCVGHITLDRVVTEHQVTHMAGGTSFYFSNAISKMNLRYLLVTVLAKDELHFISDLREQGVEVVVAAMSPYSVYFENDYTLGWDHRKQQVLQLSDPFHVDQLNGVDARLFHLGPLLADDISLEIIEVLAKRGKISLDAQGYLRKVKDKKVLSADWLDKKEALRHVHILKANESEMHVLTGCQDPKEAAIKLFEWGVREVVITLGKKGSLIYNGLEFYNIPAFTPSNAVVDATGCGDTYMAGYLFQRTRNTEIQFSGEFAAAMATLKIEAYGPFSGTEKEVLDLWSDSERKAFD
ncbi:MAG TPA: PfkB family carbohydrate kinase [Puia sp.]|nr:PfkB family carbohydrate kinase [Puia sp.]